MNRFLLALLLLTPLHADAQHWEMDLGGGLSTYFGDLTIFEIDKILNEAQPVFSLGVNNGTERAVFLRAGYHYTSFEVSNEERNLQFQTQLHEFSAQVGVNLFQLFLGRPTRFYPYFAVGLGIFHFNPKSSREGTEYDLRTLGTEGQGIQGYPGTYSLWQAVVPVYGGVKFWLTDRFSLGAELSYHHLFTDYLDDVGSTRVNYQTLLENNGAIAARFSNPDIDPENPVGLRYRRGTPSPDLYYLGRIVVGIKLGDTFDPTRRRIKNSRVRCPVLE